MLTFRTLVVLQGFLGLLGGYMKLSFSCYNLFLVIREDLERDFHNLSRHSEMCQFY